MTAACGTARLLQEELVVGRLSTDQRTAAAQATELQLVDEQLASEDIRLTAEACTPAQA